MPRELRPELEDLIATGNCNCHTTVDIDFTPIDAVVAANAGGLYSKPGTLVDGVSTIIINGVTFTFKNVPSGDWEIQIGGTLVAQLDAIVAKLNASTHPLVSVATYSRPGSSLRVLYDVPGSIGNSFTIAAEGGGMLAHSPTLQGGTDADSGIFVIHLSSGEIYINRFGIDLQYLGKLSEIQSLEMSMSPEVDQLVFFASNVDMIIGQTLTGASRRLDGARGIAGIIFIDPNDPDISLGQHIYDAKMPGEIVAGEVVDESVGFVLLSDVDAVTISGRTIASEFQWREPISNVPISDPNDNPYISDPGKRGRYPQVDPPFWNPPIWG